MDSSLILIIFILSLSGIFGGLINFFMSEEESKINVLRCIVIGLGASFMVPLFLNMISSNLLEQIRGGDPLRYFVLAGFCLVAAISSRAFILTLSERIFKDIKDAKKYMKEETSNVKEAIAPILAKETENEQLDEINGAKDHFLIELSEDQGKVLRAMAAGNFVLRSISGLSKDTGLPRESVHKEINELILKGFVRQRESEKGPRWFITSEGRKNISNI